MDVFEAALLGLVQGLTEFLPVSSSGHLVLVQELFEFQQPGALPEIAVHLGTLGSVVVYFARDLVRVTREFVVGGPGRKTGWMVILGTLPAVAAGLALKPLFEELLESPLAAGVGLLLTGTILLLTRLARENENERGVGYALLVGLAQAFAILPGVSRSGSTIAAALFLGERPEEAARFSFLLSIPVIVGAAVLLGKDALDAGTTTIPWGGLAVAAAVAFVTGVGAIFALMHMVKRGQLAVFGPYCLVLGFAVLTWLGMR